MSKKLEHRMAHYLTRLYLLEGFEAGDNFYFELGQEIKKDLEKLLPKKTAFIAKVIADRELKEITK